jgi:hypothetical protein
MKANISTITCMLCLFSFNSFSQTVKDKINKQSKDPVTKENAAKADVYIQKNIISDPGSSNNKNENPVLRNQSHKVLIYKKKKKRLRWHRHK